MLKKLFAENFTKILLNIGLAVIVLCVKIKENIFLYMYKQKYKFRRGGAAVT